MQAQLKDAKVDILHITKRYGAFKALDTVTLDVKEGEFLTLLGPSGSGKTTLLMVIAGFVRPDAGSISLGGKHITHLPPEKRGFGMVFQGYALFPHMPVRDNVAFALRMRKTPEVEITRRVNETLELVGLIDKQDHYPRELSGGQQQRVALARAIVFHPYLLLLDEPLSALDTQLRGLLQNELKHLHKAVGLTFIYVTHDQSEALSMSDRVVVMKDGQIVQVGSPSELYNQPCNHFVAEFMGVENFLPPEITGRTGIVALRAQSLQITNDKDQTCITARIIERNYHGSEIRYTATTENGFALHFNLNLRNCAYIPQQQEQVQLFWQESDVISFPGS